MHHTAQEKHYDLQKKNKATTAFGFRILVAAYLVYLTFQIGSGTLRGESPVPLVAVVLICLLFIGVAGWFGWYAWQEYRKALQAAECTEAEMQQELREAEAQDAGKNDSEQKGGEA
ncbi:MAG: hypothetical protein LKJ90_06025 [Faecalibacterium sp.]|jgi:protein-S-isoprenylcysteine O-methyltransferase Ste14|nr:hypothetical protein [Faecalibacterium sp.]